jgi:hypothetical protein
MRPAHFDMSAWTNEVEHWSFSRRNGGSAACQQERDPVADLSGPRFVKVQVLRESTTSHDIVDMARHLTWQDDWVQSGPHQGGVSAVWGKVSASTSARGFGG